MIVFYKRLEGLPLEQGDDAATGLKFVARASHVFNVQQVEGFEAPPIAPFSAFQANAEAEAFVQAVGADVRHGFATACYRRDTDSIAMPDRKRS